jgi:hypothetical protein
MTRSNRITRSAALALLGLPGDASPRDITQAYRRLAKATHPDRTNATAAPTTADRVMTDSQHEFALLADAYHVLASTPESSPAETPPPGRTSSPGPFTGPGPVSIPVRVRKPSREQPERPPIVAGPVQITPSAPPAAKPWRST